MCDYCGACVTICPADCIEVRENSIHIDNDDCIENTPHLVNIFKQYNCKKNCRVDFETYRVKSAPYFQTNPRSNEQLSFQSGAARQLLFLSN